MLALSSHLSKWPLYLRFHQKTLYAHFLPPYLPKAPPPDIILLDFVTCTIHIMQLPTMQSAAVNCYRMLSGPNIFLSTLFLSTLSLCSSLSMRHQASYNINNRQNFSSGYINIHILLDSKREVKTEMQYK